MRRMRRVAESARSVASPGEWPRGIGIGWRPEIAGVIADLPGLGFCEVIAESVASFPLDRVRSLGVPVIPHGIRLSLGSVEPVAPERVSLLDDCAELLGAPLVSEHIAFVRAGGIEAGHLLSVPRTREGLDVLSENVRRTQDGLRVPLALENIAALFAWPDDRYTEGEFLTELVERTGVHLLLDIENVYASALNRGVDPAVELARIPTERVAYCHVAGGHRRDGLYHDTHTDPVPFEVLELVTQAAVAGSVPALMLERDGNYPPAPELLAELDAVADAARLERVTVGSRWWSV